MNWRITRDELDEYYAEYLLMLEMDRDQEELELNEQLEEQQERFWEMTAA